MARSGPARPRAGCPHENRGGVRRPPQPRSPPTATSRPRHPGARSPRAEAAQAALTSCPQPGTLGTEPAARNLEPAAPSPEPTARSTEPGSSPRTPRTRSALAERLWFFWRTLLGIPMHGDTLLAHSGWDEGRARLPPATQKSMRHLDCACSPAPAPPCAGGERAGWVCRASGLWYPRRPR